MCFCDPDGLGAIDWVGLAEGVDLSAIRQPVLVGMRCVRCQRIIGWTERWCSVPHWCTECAD